MLAECRLDPADLQLLLDQVGAPAFAAGEAWAPVCLPQLQSWMVSSRLRGPPGRHARLPAAAGHRTLRPSLGHLPASLVEEGMHSLEP